MSSTVISDEPLEVPEARAPDFFEVGGRKVPITRPPPENPSRSASGPSSVKAPAHVKGTPPRPPQKGLPPLPKAPSRLPFPSTVTIHESMAGYDEDNNATVPLPLDIVRQQLAAHPLAMLPAPPLSTPDLPSPASPTEDAAHDPEGARGPSARTVPKPPSFGGSITLVGPPRPTWRRPPSQEVYAPPPSQHDFASILPPLPMPPSPAVRMMANMDYTAATMRSRKAMARPPSSALRDAAMTLQEGWRRVRDKLLHPVLRSRGACASMGLFAGLLIALFFRGSGEGDFAKAAHPDVQQCAHEVTMTAPVLPAPSPPVHTGVVMPESDGSRGSRR